MSIKSTINWFEVAFWIVLVEIIGMGSALLSGNIRAMYNHSHYRRFHHPGSYSELFGQSFIYSLESPATSFGTIAKTTR